MMILSFSRGDRVNSTAEIVSLPLDDDDDDEEEDDDEEDDDDDEDVFFNTTSLPMENSFCSRREIPSCRKRSL